MTTRNNLPSWRLLLGLLAFLACLAESRAAWYAKFDGVPGEVEEGPLAGWTRIESVGALGTNSPSQAASFSCVLRKGLDRTTPLLLKRCGDGEQIARVSLAYVLTQPQAAQYRITLRNVFVTSMSQSGASAAPAGPGEEELTLNFAKVEWACFELDANGGTVGGLTAIVDTSTGQSDLKTRLPFRAVIEHLEEQMGVRVTWPAESGHTYRILSSEALGQPWNVKLEVTAAEDGLNSQFIPMPAPALFMRVVEVD